MSQALIPPTVDNDVLVAVHEAVYMDRQLQLEYLARKRDETRHYTVHPLGLIQRGPVTYLVARFSETPKITLLAVHRIRKATRLDEIGRAHVRTPVTNAHLVCRLLLEKKKRHTPNKEHQRYGRVTLTINNTTLKLPTQKRH